MAFLAQPTTKTAYGVVGIGSYINVFDGFISLEQDDYPRAYHRYNRYYRCCPYYPFYFSPFPFYYPFYPSYPY